MAVYFICINIITFIIYGIDKRRARQHRWRISEATLILLAMLGGSVGALTGMRCFRHKTRHWKFTIGIPVILGIQILLWVIVKFCNK